MKADNRSDEELIQATGEGNLNAFEEIIRRHQTWAWWVAYRYLGHREDASDVVQEAFLKPMSSSGS